MGRGDDPLRVRPRPDDLDLRDTRAGNRFDSTDGSFDVTYFGSSLEACLGETLARFKPDPKLVAVIGDEWRRKGFMDIGSVPAEWRQRRSAVHVRVAPSAVFVDVEDIGTHQVLRDELAPDLVALGYTDLDVALVRGKDRRITRLVAQWVARARTEPDRGFAYAGIRYLSRLNSNWECWAVLGDTRLESIETKPITSTIEGLQEVATIFGLTVR